MICLKVKILTLKTLRGVSSMKFPRVNPILGPLKRSIVLLSLNLSFSGSFNLTKILFKIG